MVEIVSPDDSAEELAEKLRDYLNAGVRMAWFIYPKHRRVHVFRQGQPLRILEQDDSLDGEDVVAGFRLPLAELWR